MPSRHYFTLALSLLGIIAGCSGGGGDDHASSIFYSPARVANTSHPEVVSEIRPFLSRVCPEDPKRIAIHFAAPNGLSQGHGVWAEDLLWVPTLTSIVVVVKTPDDETFEIRPHPVFLARLANFLTPEVRAGPSGHPLKEAPTIIFDLPGRVTDRKYEQLVLAKPDKLDMSIEGTYHIHVRGTLDLQNEDIADIEFTTAETTLEVTTDGVAPVSTAIGAFVKIIVNRGWDSGYDLGHGFSPTEDEHGNRVFHCGAGAAEDGDEWAYNQASILIRPDGTLERIAFQKISTCVAEGSLVKTDQGPVPIEQLTVGTKIWGFDLDRGLNVLTPVRQIRTHIAPRTLRFPSGLRVTADHPIWAADSWKQSRDLRPGDLLRRYDGSQEPAGTPVIVASPIRVYDLDVDAPHNFFAANVLVHNKSMSPVPNDPWYDLWPRTRRPADSK